jgi:hypothetical protein
LLLKSPIFIVTVSSHQQQPQRPLQHRYNCYNDQPNGHLNLALMVYATELEAIYMAVIHPKDLTKDLTQTGID